ncbi:MAG: caspase family protein, partial [Methanolinea sp.]|nr:caspase family protein [Methanolinea sp.]
MADFRISYMGKGGAVLLALIVLCCIVTADSDYDNRWAVLIGVTNYQYIDDLDFPGNDVDDMRSVLVNSCGFPSSHVYTYKDSQAKKSGIRGAISQLSSRTGSNDLVVFYFSGHGTYRQLLDAAPFDEADGYEETLCPYDALDNSFTNDITDDELQTWLS